MSEEKSLITRLRELACKEEVNCCIEVDGNPDSYKVFELTVRQGDKSIKAAYDYSEIEKVRLFKRDEDHDDFIMEVFTNLIERIKS